MNRVFSGGINLYSRNDMLRTQLLQEVSNLCKEVKEEIPIDHAINTLVDFNWLATCQERDYNDIKTETRRTKNNGDESVAKTTVDLSSTRK